MQLRWHMKSVNRRWMVEHHFRETLEHIRREDRRFRRARIRQVLQAYPSRIRVGEVYETR